MGGTGKGVPERQYGQERTEEERSMSDSLDSIQQITEEQAKALGNGGRKLIRHCLIDLQCCGHTHACTHSGTHFIYECCLGISRAQTFEASLDHRVRTHLKQQTKPSMKRFFSPQAKMSAAFYPLTYTVSALPSLDPPFPPTWLRSVQM